MKEIKEKVTVTNVNISYEAIDGTRFTSEEECVKYEHTAKCVIQAKVNKLITAIDKDAWELFGGSSDVTIIAFKPQCKEDVESLEQFLLIVNPWYIKEDKEERRQQIFDIIENAYKENDVVLFGLYNGDYYFLNSRNNMINTLNNLDNNKE